MQLKKIIALAIGLCASNAVMAHGLWIGKVHSELTFSFGHSGADTDKYDPKKITEAVGFTNEGKKVKLETTDHKTYVTLNADGAPLVGGVMDYGFLSKNKDGKYIKDASGEYFINKPGQEVAGAVSTTHSALYTVAYLAPKIAPKKFGFPLEILPLVNPASLKQGEQLKVRVLYQGKPLKEAEVSANYFDRNAEKVKTDENGFATIKVAGSSFNIVTVAYRYNDEAKPFDGKRYRASLTFNAKREKR